MSFILWLNLSIKSLNVNYKHYLIIAFYYVFIKNKFIYLYILFLYYINFLDIFLNVSILCLLYHYKKKIY